MLFRRRKNVRKYRREPRPGTRSFPYPPDARYGGTASLAPRIYEGGGSRSGRGSSPQRRGKPPQSRLRRASSPRGEAEGATHRSCPRIYEGGGPRSGRGSPPRGGDGPLSHASRASSPKGRAKGAALRSPVVGRDSLGWQKMWKYSGFFLKKGLQNRGDSGIIPT